MRAPHHTTATAKRDKHHATTAEIPRSLPPCPTPPPRALIFFARAHLAKSPCALSNSYYHTPVVAAPLTGFVLLCLGGLWKSGVSPEAALPRRAANSNLDSKYQNAVTMLVSRLEVSPLKVSPELAFPTGAVENEQVANLLKTSS